MSLKDFKITSICERWCKILDCSSEEALGQNINKFLAHKNPFTSENTESFLRKNLELEMVSQIGNPLYVQVSVIPINDETGFEFYGSDLTELRKAQLRLRQLEHHAKVGYWERNKQGLSTWSDEVYHIFGVPVQPISTEFYESLRDVFIDNAQYKIIDQLERLFSDGTPYDFEFEILTPQGVRKWIRTTGTAIRHNGEVVRAEGMTQDVSTYRENISKLFESQERLHLALTANDMGVWQFNFKTNELTWDMNMCRLFNITPEQAPKSTAEFYALIHPEDIGRIHEETIEAMNTSNGFLNSWYRTVVNGETRYISCRGRFNRSTGQELFIGVNWDITKEKLAEETIRLQEAKIITSARLASLGEMAGGVAHEINNPLSVILARTNQLKRRSLKKEISHDELVYGLTNIEQTCDRIVKIINGLRTISREGNNDPFEFISLQQCINETIALIFEKLKNNNVKINVEVPSETISVKGRAVQIEQVLMNILNNAYDAVTGLSTKEINIELIKLGLMAQIRICDSGNGVPAEIIDSIFVPFFTTKEIGKGTGIGLSISKSIIEEHGGELGYFKDGESWYFSIILPIANEVP